MVDFGRTTCSNPDLSSQHEWLVTNGMGGYASGTVSGILTRRYHGLLIAALHPPLGQTLLVAKFDEIAAYGGRAYALGANRWAGDVIDPLGMLNLERFYLEGSAPVWQYACADALLEKRVWMAQGSNTTYVRYTLARATAPMTLEIKTLVNYRSHHQVTRVTDWAMGIDRVAHGLRITAHKDATPFFVLSDQAAAQVQHMWYRGYALAVEAYRGLESQDDHLLAGTFSVQIQPGASVTLVLSTEADASLDGGAAYAAQRAHDADLLRQAGAPDPPAHGMLLPEQQLILAADQFIVARPSADLPDGRTVMAGYPWFADWGRDTMIALPGLTLATGRPALAAQILRTFAGFVDQGMLPNRFPDAGDAPEYNTADASLWFFEAVRAAYLATEDRGLLADLFPVLQEIVAWHRRGTRYQIRVDRADGLLYAGVEGVQLTWMDAKVGDWVVTPRRGKPVEINALWYNALRIMAWAAETLGEPAQEYASWADQTQAGFARFWNPDLGYCFDVLDGPGGADASLRPNQLLAVSLSFSPLTPEQCKAVVDGCARHLVTSHGLRSLAPTDPAYIGHYAGDVAQRDGAYHQGTVWAWLMGPFVAAHLRVYQDPIAARSFLYPLLCHLSSHGLGSISEIFDGDPPFTPRGCFAQAWSVAELLRAWQLTES